MHTLQFFKQFIRVMSLAGRCLRTVGLPAAVVAAAVLGAAPAGAQTYIQGGVTDSVPGTYPSPWSVAGTGNGSLIVGNTGSGTLNILSGGTVSASFSTLGATAPATGVVNVESGGAWNHAAYITIGLYGTGLMTIAQGGTVTSVSGATIAQMPGSSGEADVSGTWSMQNGALEIAYSSNGTMRITGGTVTNGLAAISAGANGSFPPGPTGLVVVSAGTGGEPGTWTNNGTLEVGSYGIGTLEINAASTVSNASTGFVGTEAGAQGTVIVSGAGASWQNATALNVGYRGTGTLTVADGGSVADVSWGMLGYVAGSTGVATVTGAGSSWKNAANLFVGYQGTGTLAAADGGEVQASNLISIATQAGSTGTVNIGGALGSAAAAPGSLNTPEVAFGAGAGALAFNHTDTSGNYLFTPLISDGTTYAGLGAVTQAAGITILTASNTYSGPTTVQGGILRAGAANTFSPNSVSTVQTGATLDLNGYSQTVAGLSNAGTVNIGGTGATNLQVNGVYNGGGTINMVLDVSVPVSDTLTIGAGGAVSGTTVLAITPAGTPVPTPAGSPGILVVSASGVPIAGNAFTLPGGQMTMTVGGYIYTLTEGDGTADNANNWYLTLAEAPPPSPPPPPPICPGPGPSTPNNPCSASLPAQGGMTLGLLALLLMMGAAVRLRRRV